MCRSYGDQYEILLKDKRDISFYLKKQLELRNEQVSDLNARLIILQQSKENEKDLFEKTLIDLKENFRIEIDKLQNENVLLKTRLIGLEEFKQQRQTMETTIEDLKNLILRKEDSYKKALEQMEIALIIFKNKLKNEAIKYLNDLAIEFRQNTTNQISNTIKRAINENFHLNNQIDYLSNQLEKSIEINKKSTEENQNLTRTVSILEDIQHQSAKKYLTNENMIRILCDKLKQFQDEKVNQIRLAKEIKENKLIKQTLPVENYIDKQDDRTKDIENLKEENFLLKSIIDRAALSIANVIQSKDETLQIESRNEMLEQFLSLLLTSHHLAQIELPLLKQTNITKGTMPGSRLGLNQIHINPSIRAKSHYRRGDLGLILPENDFIKNKCIK